MLESIVLESGEQASGFSASRAMSAEDEGDESDVALSEAVVFVFLAGGTSGERSHWVVWIGLDI